MPIDEKDIGTHWVITADGKCHESRDWLSLPKDAVHAGTHGHGAAPPADYYEVRWGRVVSFGSNEARRAAIRLGLSHVDELLDDPRVKLGDDVADEDFDRFSKLRDKIALHGCSCDDGN